MIAMKCEAGRLLEIDSVHGTACGSPPFLDGKHDCVGYFENARGEQWVFIGDPEIGDARRRKLAPWEQQPASLR